MINRREFVARSTMAGVASSIAATPFALAQSSGKRRMTIQLSSGAIGVKADQRRAIELAGQYGFESVEAYGTTLADVKGDELNKLKDDLSAAGLVWGSSGLTVQFREDQARFEKDLKALPKVAKGLKRAGVKRVSTWLMPCHNELTYNQNFDRHATRLRAVCKILKDQGLTFGMEYVGTTSLLISRKYPFVHTMAEALELAEAIGTGNAGLVLDSWHWWQAGDSAEAIEKLDPNLIALVDLNDAPKGVEKQLQQDNRRELPLATGVIPIKGFVEALVKIGYDGPVRAEPFNQPLRDLDDGPACQATISAMRKAFALVGG